VDTLRSTFKKQLSAAISVDRTVRINLDEWDSYFFRTYKGSETIPLNEEREDAITARIFENCFPKRRVGQGPKVLVEIGVWRNHFLPFIAKKYRRFLKNSLLIGIDSGRHYPNLKEFERLDLVDYVKELMPIGDGPEALLKPLSYEYLADAQPDVYQHKRYKNLYVFQGRNLTLDNRSNVFGSLFKERVDAVFLRRMFRYMDYRAVGQDIAPHTNAISIVDYNGYAYYSTFAPSKDELLTQLKGFDIDTSEEHVMRYRLLAKRP